MLDFISCFSLEKLVIDNEICRMANRLVEGIAQREDPIAKHLFEGLTAESQFLSMPHTREWYRKEHTFPNVIDRDTYDYWVSLGQKSISERGSDQVEKLIQENPPVLLEENLQKELYKIMLADAQENEVSALPELPL